jgi:hypothetical protein
LYDLSSSVIASEWRIPEQQAGGEFRQAILHAALAQAVSFLHSMRQITTNFPAKRGQDQPEFGCMAWLNATARTAHEELGQALVPEVPDH